MMAGTEGHAWERECLANQEFVNEISRHFPASEEMAKRREGAIHQLKVRRSMGLRVSRVQPKFADLLEKEGWSC